MYLTILLWTERLIAVAIVVQTIELICARNYFSDNGIWQWSVVKIDFPNNLARVLDFALGYKTFVFVLALRLACALTLIFYSNPIILGFLAASTLLICLRWRGTYNGGSDYMSFIVLVALTVANVFQHETKVIVGCLMYIAIQSTASYFLAGVAKIRMANWRNGRAMTGFLNSASYSVPECISKKVQNPRSALLLAWAVMIFELLFPLALLNEKIAVLLISSAAIFHLLNTYVLGLNLFFWVWISTYPAVAGWFLLRSSL